MDLKNIGGNRIPHYIRSSKVYSVLAYKGSGVKRLVKQMIQEGKLVDIRAGSKAKSVIIMDNHTAYLSCHTVDILMTRLAKSPLGIIQGTALRASPFAKKSEVANK